MRMYYVSEKVRNSMKQKNLYYKIRIMYKYELSCDDTSYK